VKWRVLKDPIFVAYCAMGIRKNNESLREFLNVLIYDLHSSGMIANTWKKWYGAPMAVPVAVDPFF